ncbi:hypothetical protein ABT363_46650, partial [Streptomyces sp. NPDC000188]
MRQLSVPPRLVRLAAAVVAVTAATTGCMSVAHEGGGTAPSHSAGRHGGRAAPDGGAVVPGG